MPHDLSGMMDAVCHVAGSAGSTIRPVAGACAGGMDCCVRRSGVCLVACLQTGCAV